MTIHALKIAALTGLVALSAAGLSACGKTGELVQPADLVYSRIAAFAAPQDMPADAEAIIGKVARHPLRAGAAAGVHDVSSAEVIRRGDLVQVTYRDEGVSLTLTGQSMGTAAVGEPIAVLNTASKKVIQAVASGPDAAVVGPDAVQLRQTASSDPNTFAALR